MLAVFWAQRRADLAVSGRRWVAAILAILLMTGFAVLATHAFGGDGFDHHGFGGGGYWHR